MSRRALTSCAKSLTFLLIYFTGIPQVISGEAVPPKISINSSLQVNYSYDSPGILIGQERSSHYLTLDRTTIFPGTGLIGNVIIKNNTNETLVLCAVNNSIKNQINLFYSISADNYNSSSKLDCQLEEVRSAAAAKENAPLIMDGNILPAGYRLEVIATCPWSKLSNLPIGKITLHWNIDNSSYVLSDSSITLVNYNSKDTEINIVSSPSNREDSIYFLNQQAEYQNEVEHFEQAYTTCTLIFQIDPNDYNALRTASDVLWKMNRFDEATIYAQRGIDLITAAANEIEQKAAKLSYDDVGYYIERMQFFIDKCQRREKWKWTK